MNIKEQVHPVGTRVLIKVDAVEQKTEGGIILTADTADRETACVASGVVEAIGDEAFKGYDGAWFGVGDRVYFLKHAGDIYKINDVDYRIINDVDVTLISKADYEKRRGEQSC